VKDNVLYALLWSLIAVCVVMWSFSIRTCVEHETEQQTVRVLAQESAAADSYRETVRAYMACLEATRDSTGCVRDVMDL